MLVFCICGALCVLVPPFLFRGSEVCFYDHFSDLVYFSTAFNLCVTDIHICGLITFLLCNQDPILGSFTPLISPIVFYFCNSTATQRIGLINYFQVNLTKCKRFE